ncbi:hypothetical protein STRCI_006550 [Streptomyces cinnabarinus]|uniref:Alpha/beta hydrolase n=1 Tax=Streptomyces cinnabarinus TaxID=67287 RepID=A0ABY7KKL0_9ACTN|nr:hypothetical protein [Streptomyces cinnabarinus]WAZ25081.1 hypothetical protein STRCI_006550 [Streptomyces cinnabarinus]
MSVHRHVQWRKDSGGESYRVLRSFPAAPASATVLLAAPGSVSALDGEGRDDLLLAGLTERLVTAGRQVLQCDMPVRDPKSPFTEAELQARVERLGQLVRGSRHLTAGPLTLVGFSLGGQALLRLLESGSPPRADRVVLVGTVVDEDVFLSSRVPAVELVYGSRDLIGYLVEDSEGSDKNPQPAVFEPGMYGDWSARHVIGSPTPEVRVHVLEGLGHTLHPVGPGPARDPLRALTSLVGIAS